MAYIQPLPRTDYEGYAYRDDFESDGYYDVHLRSSDGGFKADLVRMPFPTTYHKNDLRHLYTQGGDAPEAHGILQDDQLAALIEFTPEVWNNRLRILSLWVHPEFRREGYGRQLIDLAKEKAAEYGRRAIVMTVESSNAPAIRFYLTQGFMLSGFDTTAFSNEDMERKEVLLSLTYRPPRRPRG